MRKQTDKQKLIKLLDSFGVEVTSYTNRRFICEDALNNGATETISLQGKFDFNFKSDGTFVGTSTDQAKSFKLHKDIEKIKNLLKIKK